VINRIKFSIFAFILTVSALNTEGHAGIAEEPIYHVSMIKVLADPEKFLGKRISLAGYLAHRDLPILFLMEEYAFINNVESGIYVSRSDVVESSCFGRFVVLSGRFEKDSSGAHFLREIISMMYARSEDGILVSCRGTK